MMAMNAVRLRFKNERRSVDDCKSIVYERIGLPALNKDACSRDEDSCTELGGTGGRGNEDIMYVRRNATLCHF